MEISKRETKRMTISRNVEYNTKKWKVFKNYRTQGGKNRVKETWKFFSYQGSPKRSNN